MKKRYLVCILAIVLLTSCKEAESPNSPKTAEAAEENLQEAQTGTETESDMENGQGQTADDSERFVFLYDEFKIYVNQDMENVLAAIGEPQSYFEATSCAFDGLDKIYTYGSFEIDTYPDGDKDYIASIYLKDDAVETEEGVSLFMTRKDMEEAYGEEYELESGSFVYQKGDGMLCFVIENGEIISIEYKTTVTKQQ